jgi:hypothetical protein
MNMDHLRIVVIRNVDMYRDGGTIGIKCHGYLEPQGKMQEFELCFDQRMTLGEANDLLDSAPNRNQPEGALWIGYPEEEGSVEIVDATIKAYVVKELSEYKRHQQGKIDVVLSGLSPKSNELP